MTTTHPSSPCPWTQPYIQDLLPCVSNVWTPGRFCRYLAESFVPDRGTDRHQLAGGSAVGAAGQEDKGEKAGGKTEETIAHGW